MKELETKIAKALYNSVLKNFGQTEADDPCYNFDVLARDVANELEPKTLEQQQHEALLGYTKESK